MASWVGIERPTEGSVRVLGIDPWKDRPAALERLGYVPQTPSLYRNLSVIDHLALASSARRSFDRDLAASRLRQLGIDLQRRCDALSGGQQAQVSLALALGTRAPVLLLDEPLASLDPLARREFLHVLVDDVRANGTTALLTSHVVSDVVQACDHLVVLGAGHKLLDQGIPAALARHRVVAGASESAHVVAMFPDAAGRAVSLLNGSASGRPATLEEVVMGYLATERTGDPSWNLASPAFAASRLSAVAETDGLVDFDLERGEPVVVKSGASVAEILAELARDQNMSVVIRGRPDLTPEDVRASLQYAALLVRVDADETGA